MPELCKQQWVTKYTICGNARFECPDKNLKGHKQGEMTLTFHDEDWNLLKIVDISNMQLVGTNLYRFARQFFRSRSKTKSN
ncbi:hypothetical protein GF322_02330 [Candidatus Dependentiae bacterium]|nr:hypothetical protein [Candidatus Dependentiae bacterium]